MLELPVCPEELLFGKFWEICVDSSFSCFVCIFLMGGSSIRSSALFLTWALCNFRKAGSWELSIYSIIYWSLSR